MHNKVQFTSSRQLLTGVNASITTLPDIDTRFTAIFQDNWVSRYQNVSILGFIGAKDEGGGGDS